MVDQTNASITKIQTSPLHLQNVTKRFGSVMAVDHVSLEIPRGSFTTLLGPSGCGKTTLLRIIAGFYTPDEGNIYLDDQRVDQMPAHQRGTAMVFQDYALWPHMSVYDNIAYGLRMRKVSDDEIRKRIEGVMQLVEMPAEFLKRKPTELSGGQQQRVAVARALIVQPRVLLLDEPLSNLDAKVRQRLRVEIRRLQRRIGITTIYVTHDQEEALSMSDKVVVMNRGKVMQVGTPEEIYHKPTTAFVAEFLGVTNVLRGTVAVDGDTVQVAGTSIHSKGTPGNPVTVIFKADEAIVTTFDSTSASTVAFCGMLEEIFFIGTVYRHYVNVNGEMILVDSPTRVDGKDVRVTVPRDKIKVF
ncbi:MAG: ABC transporter ATP-binding protein [Chloroflexi bacterium]|nr:ABC transporter ATP-binding protein [Chloroflexota bacterium]